MSLLQLLNDHRVPFHTEGHKHCRPGWVNMPCPFCTGNPGYHLGFNASAGYFVCWRCGGHALIPTFSRLLGVSPDQVKSLIRGYRIRSMPAGNQAKMVVRKKAFKFPAGTGPMTDRHLNYLRKRGFNAKEVTERYGLLGTGPVSPLDGIDYKHRIIIPISWEGRVVSFQGRDITDRSQVKYLACSESREIINHKTILYGDGNWQRENPCIIVEGVTDAWRIPWQVAAVFGIQYKIEQVKLIAGMFKHVIVVFDDDPQAVVQSKKLSADLRFRGVDARSEFIQGDPGGLTDEQARYLVRERMGLTS